MLRDSATLSRDAYLAEMNTRYFERYLAHRPGNVWHHLFDYASQLGVSPEALDGFSDYTQFGAL
jgi:hypothetical protein